MAAADCAQYDESSEPLLELALDCAKYNSLPGPGGVNDQEAGLLSKLLNLESVFKSFNSMRYTTLDMKKWSESNQQYWTICAHVEAMRRDKELGEL